MNDEDQTLLERYAREESEPAFAELVRRHVDMVWGAARRITGDADLARDVAQTVFTDLARKARYFPSAVSIPGWIYRATTMAARNALRTRIRRQRRESEAMHIHPSEAVHPEACGIAIDRLMPLLDQGLQTLSEPDREAVVLRFFARKSLAEIGRALAISDDAAQKRISRALERLKAFFEMQGQTVPAAVVLSVLTTAAAAAAPAGVTAAVAATSCAAASSMGMVGSSLSWITGMGQQIAIMKTKILVASLASAAVGTPLILQSNALSDLEHERAALAPASVVVQLQDEEAGLKAQRQLAAEWQQHLRDRAELEQLRAEAKRLQAVAAMNPDLQRDLGEAREKSAAARAAAKFAIDTVESEQLRVHTVNAMKHLGLAARIYATDHSDRFPGSFDLMTNELTGAMSGGLTLDKFEFMPHEREINETEPQMILFREKEPRRLPDGKWTRAYTFADGSVQQRESDTPDFTEWEKDYIARKQEHVSR